MVTCVAALGLAVFAGCGDDSGAGSADSAPPDDIATEVTDSGVSSSPVTLLPPGLEAGLDDESLARDIPPSPIECGDALESTYEYDVAQDLQSLASNSTDIVVGVVTQVDESEAVPLVIDASDDEIEALFGDEGPPTEVHTRVSTQVEMSIAGSDVQPGDTITRVVTGGSIGDQSICIPEEPVPAVATRQLLFLTPLPANPEDVTHVLVHPGEFNIDANNIVHPAGPSDRRPATAARVDEAITGISLRDAVTRVLESRDRSPQDTTQDTVTGTTMPAIDN